MSCKCGDNCSCGSDCNCGKYTELGLFSNSVPVIITGIATVKAYYEGSEMSYGAENDGCNCGSNCSCGSDCKCGK
ncbi:Metallothionein [Parasponia andersonii]|uniref:Metallothionein-like protein n=1 Tax=Parasponia andersonii TaxID=3476 RepID=A0A2P5AJI1_PARAD|nr:Metallothionein [Parasponia andersonii]